jgi:hypothetical protein
MPEQKAIERIEHEALRASRRTGHGDHVSRRQAPLEQVGPGARAGQDLQCTHQNFSVTEAL